MSKIFIIKAGLTDYIEGNLNFITQGVRMFDHCTNLTSFNYDLSSLTGGNYMFSNCSNLTSFNGDLSSLTSGYYMFEYCRSLTSFNNDMSSVTDCGNMFYYCSNLTSFNGDLRSLTSGSKMFGSSTSTCTKLDLASVQNIAETINDLAAKGTTGSISIGISKTIQGNTELEAALATIRSKGWTVSEIYKS